MSNIQEDIDKLIQESAKQNAEAQRLSALSTEFPDLQKRVGRWNKVAYYSKSVNTKVQRFDIRHNCGCCNDSPLEVWPYLETPHGKVYSDPPMFQVGEKHWISGDKPYSGWKVKLRNADIPEEIIGAVQVHFDQCKQDRILMANEDEEDSDE